MCESHLDYGMPKAFPGGVIDLQHHASAPLGCDVCTPDQRRTYAELLDSSPEPLPAACR